MCKVGRQLGRQGSLVKVLLLLNKRYYGSIWQRRQFVFHRKDNLVGRKVGMEGWSKAGVVRQLDRLKELPSVLSIVGRVLYSGCTRGSLTRFSVGPCKSLGSIDST